MLMATDDDILILPHSILSYAFSRHKYLIFFTMAGTRVPHDPYT